MKPLKILLYATVFVVVTGMAAAGGLYYYMTRDLPSMDGLYIYTPPTTTKVFSNDGRPIGEFFIERRVVVSLTKMPDYLINAFVAAEDSNFYEHEGVDFFGVARAFLKNIAAGRIVQGGSTITQQVAKSFFLSPERKYKRKFKEAVLAYRMEKNLSKEDILHLYLNQIYFGNGSYGVQVASENYFGKDIEEVTVAEAALLAGLPKAPSRYSPYANPEAARRRQEFVLKRMLEEGHITMEEADKALADPLVLRPKKADSLWAGPYFTEHIRRYVEEKYGGDLLYKGGLQIHTTMDVDLQVAANDAVDFGLRAHDKRRGYRGPAATLTSEKELLKFKEESIKSMKRRPFEAGRIYSAVITSIDEKPFALRVSVGDYKGIVASSDMKWARLYNPTDAPDGGEKIKLKTLFGVGDVIDVLVKSIPAKSIPSEEERPVPMRLEQAPLAQAALLAMEPRTGFVVAMVGGSDFSKSQYNRAIQSRRQPGSAFKPVIYTAALDKDYTPASIVIDSPLTFVEEVEEKPLPSEDGAEVEVKVIRKTWKPVNYDGKYRGKVTVRKALTKSLNVVTVKILREIGVRRAIRYARKLGIESPLAKDLSLALGSSGISLLELTRAYATLANLGSRPEPIFITKIVDRHGEVLEENQPVIEETITPETAFITTSLLQGVVQDGTGWRAKALKRPVAGKTGTTNNLNDAWFLGFSPELAAGVWVGYDSEKALGRSETGSKTASPIWVRFMKKALKGKPKTNFPIPPGIEFAKIDPETGLLAGPGTKKPIFEVFKAGTAPSRPATSYPMEDTRELDFFQLDEEESNSYEYEAPLDFEELDEEEMI